MGRIEMRSAWCRERRPRTGLGELRRLRAELGRLEGDGADQLELERLHGEIEALLPAAMEELRIAPDSGASAAMVETLLRGRK
jgi:hypothetical protein